MAAPAKPPVVDPSIRGIYQAHFERLEKPFGHMYPLLFKTIADFVASDQTFFGPASWHDFFHVTVDPVPEPPAELVTFWQRPDPFDPSRRVCETHFLPMLCPERVSRIDAETGLQTTVPYTLRECIRLNQEAIEIITHKGAMEHGDTPAEPAHWVVMKKEIVYSDHKTYKQQQDLMTALNEKTGVHYETMPSALDVATVARIEHASTGNLPFHEYTRCREHIEAPQDVFFQATVMVGNDGAPNRLVISDQLKNYDNSANVGIVPIRIFPATWEES